MAISDQTMAQLYRGLNTPSRDFHGHPRSSTAADAVEAVLRHSALSDSRSREHAGLVRFAAIIARFPSRDVWLESEGDLDSSPNCMESLFGRLGFDFDSDLNFELDLDLWSRTWLVVDVGRFF